MKLIIGSKWGYEECLLDFEFDGLISTVWGPFAWTSWYALGYSLECEAFGHRVKCDQRVGSSQHNCESQICLKCQFNSIAQALRGFAKGTGVLLCKCRRGWYMVNFNSLGSIWWLTNGCLLSALSCRWLFYTIHRFPWQWGTYWNTPSRKT